MKQSCTESALYLSGELLCESINLSKHIQAHKTASDFISEPMRRLAAVIRTGVGFMAYDDK